MSEVNETTTEQRDFIAIKLEELKEPEPIKEEITTESDVIASKVEELEPETIKEEKTDDDDIVKANKTGEIELKIEVKPENVLIDGVEHLYSYMKIVHTAKITPTNVVVIATELMQIVEKYKELTGPQKKMLVINVIKRVVNNQVDTQEIRTTLNTIIDFTLPIVIDNLVSAMNGEIKFNKEKVQSFFKKYLCCCISK